MAVCPGACAIRAGVQGTGVWGCCPVVTGTFTLGTVTSPDSPLGSAFAQGFKWDRIATKVSQPVAPAVSRIRAVLVDCSVRAAVRHARPP